MKKIILCFILIFFILPAINIKHVNAIECSDTIIEFDDNNCYYETMLETYSSKARSSTIRSGKKTTSYKNSSGEILWSVSVTGTFTYNGNSATCTSSSVSTTCPNSSWKITSKSANKSGATAKATATAKRYNNGSVIETKTKTVTLTCSATGTLS